MIGNPEVSRARNVFALGFYATGAALGLKAIAKVATAEYYYHEYNAAHPDAPYTDASFTSTDAADPTHVLHGFNVLLSHINNESGLNNFDSVFGTIIDLSAFLAASYIVGNRIPAMIMRKSWNPLVQNNHE
jgi:hypothetical protein